LPVVRRVWHVETTERKLLLNVDHCPADRRTPEILLPNPDVTATDTVARTPEALLLRERQVKEALRCRGKCRKLAFVYAVSNDRKKADFAKRVVDLIVDTIGRNGISPDKA